MHEASIGRVARLLHDRNSIDDEIASVLQRPVTQGHFGEWVAAQVFRVQLESSAVTPDLDGYFTTGALRGRSVNVKYYAKREGTLDLKDKEAVDCYLVLTGPKAAAGHSGGTKRPWWITNAYLFEVHQLLKEQRERGVRIGVASSVTDGQWAVAEIYPRAMHSLLPLDQKQRSALGLFAPR